MVCWSENVSITCDILTDIFRTLDIYELFQRHHGLIPFDLMDAHGSRIEFTFHIYVNNPETKGAFYIGVPYGTSL